MARRTAAPAPVGVSPDEATAEDRVLDIDFSAIPDIEALPAGTYPVEVTAVSLETASTGNKYLKWVLGVLDGEYVGRQLFMNTTLTPNALWRVKQIVKALGLNEDAPLDLDACEGKTALAVVGQRDYEGRTQNEVKSMRPLAGSGSPEF